MRETQFIHSKKCKSSPKNLPDERVGEADSPGWKVHWFVWVSTVMTISFGYSVLVRGDFMEGYSRQWDFRFAVIDTFEGRRGERLWDIAGCMELWGRYGEMYSMFGLTILYWELFGGTAERWLKVSQGAEGFWGGLGLGLRAWQTRKWDLSGMDRWMVYFLLHQRWVEELRKSNGMKDPSTLWLKSSWCETIKDGFEAWMQREKSWKGADMRYCAELMSMQNAEVLLRCKRWAW